MRKIICFLFVVSAIACHKNTQTTLSNGYYRITLDVKDNKQIPFIARVTSENTLEIYNAEEVIHVDEIQYKNDSVYIQTPVFEGYIAAKITKDGFEGHFIKESLDRIVRVKAEKGNNIRFEITDKSTPASLEGIWETVFSQNSEEDRYIAKGIFKQKGNQVTGTFRTTTGDYRYLEGVVNGHQFHLSTFDGAHAFLFTGTLTDSTLTGNFYSGNHWKEPFVAKRNPTYELPSAEGLTYLKEGYHKFSFSFPDENGNSISLEDEQFKNKVTIVQIMGTWCPNCLDESKFYTQFSKENPAVKFVSLAFEVAKTPEIAFQRINRLKKRIGIKYPILLAQYGSDSKLIANEKLPMLNHVLSYPTTIFVDKKGNVRKIHTGFNGPATGDLYLEFQKEFKSFVNLLLKE